MSPTPTLTEAAAEYRKAHAAYSLACARVRETHLAYAEATAKQEELATALLAAQTQLSRAAEVDDGSP